MELLGKLIINSLALLVVEYIIPGFELADYKALLVTTIIIGVVNTFIRPTIQVIALPISILTLGIFAFLINVVLLYSVAYIVPGFEITSFLTATAASILLALVSSFLNHLARSKT